MRDFGHGGPSGSDADSAEVTWGGRTPPRNKVIRAAVYVNRREAIDGLSGWVTRQDASGSMGESRAIRAKNLEIKPCESPHRVTRCLFEGRRDKIGHDLSVMD